MRRGNTIDYYRDGMPVVLLTGWSLFTGLNTYTVLLQTVFEALQVDGLRLHAMFSKGLNVNNTYNKVMEYSKIIET